MSYKVLKEVNNYIKPILENEHVALMKNYIQHGKTNTYEHSINVANLSYKISKLFNIKINMENVLTGAMLHDFYLYDWHNRSIKDGLHGYNHSKIALENAKRIFNVNKNIQNIILSHMWPLNITKLPLSKEAWIVCISDKICSIKETFLR